MLWKTYIFLSWLVRVFFPGCKLPKQISCFDGTSRSCRCWTCCKCVTRCSRNRLSDLQVSDFLQPSVLSFVLWSVGVSWLLACHCYQCSVWSVCLLTSISYFKSCAVFFFLALSYLKSQHEVRSCYSLIKTSSWVNCNCQLNIFLLVPCWLLSMIPALIWWQGSVTVSYRGYFIWAFLF